jgi:4'-phosphopantetheinyl transferase
MTRIHWADLTENAFFLNHTVNIWKIDYKSFSGDEKQWLHILNNQEQTRAQKFHYQADRKRYRVTRALLKIILSRISGNNPVDISFSYNNHGKPYLKNTQKISFNVSHSGDLGLIAVSDLTLLGIDVEKYRKRIDPNRMAKRFFSMSEQKELSLLSDNHILEGFFNGWTRKEAVIKALGLGLAMPLRNFDVTLTPGQPARLLNIRHQDEKVQDWTINNIPMDGDYAAAYAVKARDFTHNFWTISGLI